MNGQLSCVSPEVNTGVHAVVVDSLHPTGQGIEGRFAGPVGGGCSASLHFAAALDVNQ